MDESTVGQRIASVRKTLGMTQVAFGKELDVSRSVISNIEYNYVVPAPLFISHLCERFNINRVWLESGTGEMFNELTEDEEIANLMGATLNPATDERKKRIIFTLMKMVHSLPDEYLPIVHDYAKMLVEATQTENKKEEGE